MPRLKALGNSNRPLSEDIQRLIMTSRPRTFMKVLKEEFLMQEPDSPIVNTLWKTMILLSVFHKKDWEFLRNIFLSLQKDDMLFMQNLAKFQIKESEKKKGTIWLGGLTSKRTSLHDEMINRGISEGPNSMREIYKRFRELMNG